ncbi:unnamed protein product [Cylicostephanus goldi]|uniref:Suppressor of forked domain-containing protein n=1 Tax=Cylicostephanus goldi TaxID=71465 RepID=A0A3P6SH27_CYLGO|nr:unnamed protein product [Cylicostephanus goldi]
MGRIRETVLAREAVHEDDLLARRKVEEVVTGEPPKKVWMQVLIAAQIATHRRHQMVEEMRALRHVGTEVVRYQEVAVKATMKQEAEANNLFLPLSRTWVNSMTLFHDLCRICRSRSPDFERSEILRDSWAALKRQPDNFDAWIMILTQADQSNDVKLARDIYDRFLKKYPYCYGFWKKYAEMERRHQNFSDALSVWERGILAIPLSIDLWLGFLSFMRELAPQSDRGIEKLRELYDRAVSTAGHEFHSDRLWQDYIAWEEAQGEWRRVAEIYDRLIRIPTALYKSHMER